MRSWAPARGQCAGVPHGSESRMQWGLGHGDVADEDVVRVLSQRVRHVLERVLLGLAEPDGGLADGGIVAELGDVAPAGLPHVGLPCVEAPELHRRGLGAVYECIDVSLLHRGDLLLLAYGHPVRRC